MNSHIKIDFNKRSLYTSLFLGLIWLMWFFVMLIGKEKLSWTDYGWFFISLSYFGIFIYQKHFKYVTIKNGIITTNGPFGKKLHLHKIKKIKKFTDDYILKTDLKEMTIHTKVIEKNSLLKLNKELEKLNLEWV